MSGPRDTLFRTSDDGGSEVDSDLEELRDDIAKLDESVREFLTSHYGTEITRGNVRGGTKNRVARGPRKAAKPRGDITARLSKVNQAFLSGDYDQALDLATEVIRINAETHQAWTTLASIFRERGESRRALSAMVYAAHLRPKDVSGWLKCATFALEINENVHHADENLYTARLCYSASLRADPTHLGARLGKAAVCHRQGHLAAAITEYKFVLQRQPHDLELVRKLAEACLDSKNVSAAVPSAVQAYKQFFNLEMKSRPLVGGDDLWHDVGIFVDLFASLGQYGEAIFELKTRSRWLVGRPADHFWDRWQDDDREWDVDELRRLSAHHYFPSPVKSSLYGSALPHDLRFRLAIYRFKLGHESEALVSCSQSLLHTAQATEYSSLLVICLGLMEYMQNHLDLLGWDDSNRKEFVKDYPFLTYDLASELARYDRQPLAIQYFQLLRESEGDSDPAVLLQLGRSHLALGKQSSAEECFLAAIEADQHSIDARIELANIYEKAREDEEALILAAEAMALREAGAQSASALMSDEAAKPDHGPVRRGRHRIYSSEEPAALASDSWQKSIVPRRYRPKRLAGPNRRLEDEQARVAKLTSQYEAVRDLKQQILGGRHDVVPVWMTLSKELVDDFRSLKRFYTWDKYLHFLGSKRRPYSTSADEEQVSELSEMYERLSRCVAPQGDQSGRGLGFTALNGHRGISFDDWLDLFLDYAIGLALVHRREEAYQICKAAKDSTVFQSPEHCFSIHVAWTVCAIYTSDEERCVAIARHLMRDGALTDSYRMFALLSRLSQSPVAWYTSGPAQKFILRQIKATDASHLKQRTEETAVAANSAGLNVDICLLMLYGHILFTSTSYAYSLSYFLRARSIDPSNPMINLSLGLAYVHYGLKRQSANRQYLLLQGQTFLSQYLQSAEGVQRGYTAERLYNLGRLFHLLGISDLSTTYYSKALQAQNKEVGSKDLSVLITINSVLQVLAVKNDFLALLLLKTNLIL